MTIFSVPTYLRKMNDAGCMLLDEQMRGEFKVNEHHYTNYDIKHHVL